MLPKRNFQLELDEIISSFSQKPTLLLHSCCAPCSSYVIEYLRQHFQITVFFYNPNISSNEEYNKRLSEQKRFLDEFDNSINVIEGDYTPDLFYNNSLGLENEKEGGTRCEKCFDLRLFETARYCSQHGFDYFATTLTLSPHKNAFLVNEAGEKAAKEFGCQYLVSDFKKRNGYKRSIELSQQYGLYRQDFCGCEFSKRD